LLGAPYAFPLDNVGTLYDYLSYLILIISLHLYSFSNMNWMVTNTDTSPCSMVYAIGLSSHEKKLRGMQSDDFLIGLETNMSLMKTGKKWEW
jgi:hypothetical protein